ncbi:SCO1664 family protein [Streptomyces sodiiphilus]|uniref:SCO1664 family protein n=1 Tax=Streptomyces sodiiphilus TaxID=226217 RepID=A0ABN2PYT4_9ACTN
MSAPERIPAQPGLTADELLLSRGRLTVHGRVVDASNAVLFATAELDGRRAPCVYKPVAGESPLWDFPEGTLARREVAAYTVSRALGWPLVPPTVLRDGPHGEGMCQLWVGPEPGSGEDSRPAGDLLALVDGDEPGPGWKAIGYAETAPGRTALLVHADDERLRRMAVLDAVINNADRKGRHLLPLPDGRLYGIDHGVTFHTEDKLRTLLWGWAGEPLPPEAMAVLGELSDTLEDPGSPLSAELASLLGPDECRALRERTARLLTTGRHPAPGGRWPVIPWPPV